MKKKLKNNKKFFDENGNQLLNLITGLPMHTIDYRRSSPIDKTVHYPRKGEIKRRY